MGRARLLGLFLALVIVACGGVGNREVGTAPSTTVDVPKAAELRKTLLTAKDLPSGFVEDPSASNDDDEGPGICKQFDPDAKVPSLTDADVAFLNEPASLFALEAIAVYSGDDARRYMTELGNVFVKCGEFTDVEEDGSSSNGAISGIEFPPYGDETTAMSIHVDGVDFSFTMYSVFVRVENIVLAVGLGGVAAPDADVVKTLVEKAVRKVEAAL